MDVFVKKYFIKHKIMAMKEMFPGFYKKSEESLKELWDNGLITFDANVLLSLYRYSNTTRKEIFSLFKKIDTKIWLTHQVVLEYHRNRCEVISDQEKVYISFHDQICQIENDLSSKKQPPFLSDRLYRSLTTVFNKVKDEVQARITEYGEYLTVDPICDELNDLFKDKIGNSFTATEQKEIISIGKLRYENKIPPGYEDEKTKGGDKKFGDLIIWNQILNKAKEVKMPIIFVTNEIKKDWWWKLRNDKILGPRQELVEEMLNITGMDFHMYSSERFLEFGLEYLNEKVNQKAIEEITEFTKSDARKFGEILGTAIERNLNKGFGSILDLGYPNQSEVIFIVEDIRLINKNIYDIDFQINSLPRDTKGNILDKEKEALLLIERNNLEFQRISRQRQLAASQGVQFFNTSGSEKNKID